MKVGDKLTILLPGSGEPPAIVISTRTLLVRYKGPHGVDQFVWTDANNIDGFSWVKDEYTKWCRGWGQEEIDAMKAAHALGPSRPRLRFADDTATPSLRGRSFSINDPFPPMVPSDVYTLEES